MSSTNRAFIKAYRQDAPDPSPVAGPAPTTRGPIGPASREAAMQTSTSVRDAAYSTYESRSATGKRPLSSFINRPASITPPEAQDRDTKDDKDANFLQPGTTVA